MDQEGLKGFFYDHVDLHELSMMVFSVFFKHISHFNKDSKFEEQEDGIIVDMASHEYFTVKRLVPVVLHYILQEMEEKEDAYYQKMLDHYKIEKKH